MLWKFPECRALTCSHLSSRLQVPYNYYSEHSFWSGNVYLLMSTVGRGRGVLLRLCMHLTLLTPCPWPHREFFLSAESWPMPSSTLAEFFRNWQWLRLFCLSLYLREYIKNLPERRLRENPCGANVILLLTVLGGPRRQMVRSCDVNIHAHAHLCQIRKRLHLLCSDFSWTCYIFPWSRL